jgi:hypothetical protein
MRVAVLQSNYLPWKGYFDLIHDVDLFVFYDDVQYTKNDWRNRNRIKTPKGSEWITIPAGYDLSRLICEVRIKGTEWQKQHWSKLCRYYSAASCFRKYEEFFRYVYLEREWTMLSELNQFLIRHIAREFLGIKTVFVDSRNYELGGRRTARLIDLLRQVRASCYLSGPAGKAYIDEEAFRLAGIELEYKDYEGYPEYQQFYPPFDPFVSVVDLLFQAGDQAAELIWDWRK